VTLQSQTFSLTRTSGSARLDPTHQRATGNLKYFEYQLAKQKKVEQSEEEEERRQRRESRGRPDDYLPERKKYEQLCRGQGVRMVRRHARTHARTHARLSHDAAAPHSLFSCQTPRRQSRLFCRYYDNSRHPKYVIGPVKQEDEWDRPRIVRYHDIVSDGEMEKVKELAKPRVSSSLRSSSLDPFPLCFGSERRQLTASRLQMPQRWFVSALMWSELLTCESRWLSVYFRCPPPSEPASLGSASSLDSQTQGWNSVVLKQEVVCSAVGHQGVGCVSL